MAKTLSNRMHLEEVAARLELTFEAVGLKPAQVAAFLGTTTSKIGNWTGARNYPDEYQLTRFCDRYGVTMDWIYRGNLYGVPASLADGLAVAWEERKAELEEARRLAGGGGGT